MATLTNPWNGSVDFTREIHGVPMSDLLSERSRKFYDGTYKFDAEGFVDDKGEYRKFSDDPDAQPPTPLPPAPLSNNGFDPEDEVDSAVVLSPSLPAPRPVQHDEAVSPTTILPKEARSEVIGQEGAGMSDMEVATDPGSRRQTRNDIRKAAFNEISEDGRREANSTPVGATKGEMGDPTKPPPVRAPLNSRNLPNGGDDDGSDSDKDNKKKKIPKSDHTVAKTKKRKDDDDDDDYEDDADKENDGAAKKEDTPAEKKTRKDSKQSSGKQSRKSSAVTAASSRPVRKTARQLAMEEKKKKTEGT